MKPNDFSDARVLVTGGAGFIGSALVWALNRRGCDNIVVCDILGTDEKRRNLTPLSFADYVEAADLQPRLQSGALGKFDLILHMGACSATTEKNASYLARNNYEFTKDLAVWSLANKSRFVYASSAATYGDGSAGMEDNEAQLDALDRKSTRLNSSHTEIYTLSLHDALPICVVAGEQIAFRLCVVRRDLRRWLGGHGGQRGAARRARSEEHTSELQSHRDLHSFPTRRSSDLCGRWRTNRVSFMRRPPRLTAMARRAWRTTRRSSTR